MVYAAPVQARGSIGADRARYAVAMAHVKSATDLGKLMNLDDFKSFLYKERQAVDALATTVKTNMASLMAILAAIAIPFVPAIFAANGVYIQTTTWSEDWRKWAAIATAVAIEGAGMFLSILATKTYSAWQKKAATVKEIYAMVGAVGIYTIIVVVLITLSNVPWGLKIIIALIPLLGVAFYIGMGFEIDLANRLDEIADEKRRKREERKMQTHATHEKAPSVYLCESCEREFATVQALSAHLRFCVAYQANGKAK